MFEIVVDTKIESSPPFVVRVYVRSRDLDDYGLVCDFHDVRRIVRKFCNHFDAFAETFTRDLHEHLKVLWAGRKYWPEKVELRTDSGQS